MERIDKATSMKKEKKVLLINVNNPWQSCSIIVEAYPKVKLPLIREIKRRRLLSTPLKFIPSANKCLDKKYPVGNVYESIVIVLRPSIHLNGVKKKLNIAKNALFKSLIRKGYNLPRPSSESKIHKQMLLNLLEKKEERTFGRKISLPIISNNRLTIKSNYITPLKIRLLRNIVESDIDVNLKGDFRKAQSKKHFLQESVYYEKVQCFAH